MLALLFILAAPPLPSEVPALVRKLGADTRAERDGASKSLEKIGARAVKELRKALSSRDAEIRRRARQVLTRIEQNLYHEVHAFKGHSNSVNAVAFSPDGKLVASGDSRSLRLWDLKTGKVVAKTDEHSDRVMAAAFSPDGKLVATGSEDRTVRLWKVPTLEEVHVMRGHRWDVRSVAFSADGKRLYSACQAGHLHEWNVESGKSLRKAALRGRAYFACVPLADGQRILTAAKDCVSVEVVHLGRQAISESLRGHERQVMGLALSRDGKLALSASHDTTVRLWDAKTLKDIGVLRGHKLDVNCVAVRPDASLAVSGGLDQSVYVWDLESRRRVRELKGHEGAIWSVAISPDGKFALSGGQDGTMRLWTLGE